MPTIAHQSQQFGDGNEMIVSPISPAHVVRLTGKKKGGGVYPDAPSPFDRQTGVSYVIETLRDPS